MVNFENAKKDGKEDLARVTLLALQQKVREYSASVAVGNRTPDKIAAALNKPERRAGEEWPGAFVRMSMGLPYAANMVTTEDVEDALNA